MLSKSDPLWNEYSDPAIVDWKRIRAEIEHENQLVNHRLGWLFSSQAFLFAAFALVFQTGIVNDMLYYNKVPLVSAPPVAASAPSVNASLAVSPAAAAAAAAQLERKNEYVGAMQTVLFTIPLIGFSICAFILVSLDAAHKHINLLERWWKHHYLQNLSWRDVTDVQKLEQPPINGIFSRRIYKVFSTKWLPWPIGFGWVLLSLTVLNEYILKVERSRLVVASLTSVVFVVLGLAYHSLRQESSNSDAKT